MIQQGELQPALFDWLRQNIWQHGSRFSTSQLITQATGEDLNIRYFREHLNTRYLSCLIRAAACPAAVFSAESDPQLSPPCPVFLLPLVHIRYTPIPITHGNPEFTGI